MCVYVYMCVCVCVCMYYVCLCTCVWALVSGCVHLRVFLVLCVHVRAGLVLRLAATFAPQEVHRQVNLRTE